MTIASASATSTSSPSSDIWHGAKRREVLEHCSNKLDLETCQVCCKGHEINKFLHLVETPDPAMDVNFL